MYRDDSHLHVHVRLKHGITRQVYEAYMACLNQLKTVLYHGKTTTNTSYDMVNMNLTKVLTYETNMATIENNKEMGWPSPS